MSIKPHVNGRANGAGSTSGKSQTAERRLDSTPHLTDRARKAVVHGEEEAWQRGLQSVRTEHLLLGMIRQRDNVAAVILKHLGVDLDAIRIAVDEAPVDASNEAPDCSAASCVHLAHEEARLLGNNYIGTEHLLLGLIREENCLGARVLRDCGVTLVDARREVDKMQRGERGGPIMKEPLTNVPYHTEVVAATRLASLLGHAHVTPVHLAVVLLSDPTEPVIRLLGQFGVDAASLLAHFPEADATTPAGHPTHPSMSYAAGHVLVRAVEKAHALCNEQVAGREHLLLALLEDPETVGTVFRGSGLEPYAALLELLRLREKGL